MWITYFKATERRRRTTEADWEVVSNSFARTHDIKKKKKKKRTLHMRVMQENSDPDSIKTTSNVNRSFIMLGVSI